MRPTATWSANLAEEAPWYLKRFHGGYQYVGILLVLLHFALPFLLLLSRDLKRNPNTLLILAVWMVFIRVIDLYYLINPTAHGEHGHGPDLRRMRLAGR